MTTSILERYFEHLRQRPGVDADASTGRVLWPAIDRGERADERVEFLISEPELRVAIQEREHTAGSVWPDIPRELAAFRMLYTNMMECAESERSRTTRRFRLTNGEFVAMESSS